jgi:hypothetical protein
VIRVDVRSRGGRRYLKRFVWSDLGDGRIKVETNAGYRGHPFDDLKRTFVIGPRGGLSGWGREGNGKARRAATVSGAKLLYAMNALRANT